MADIAASKHMFLAHGLGFGPMVDLAPQVQVHGGVEATAVPIRLENQPWNAWPDGTARLFNDAVAFGMAVEIRGSNVSWDPRHTELAVNTAEQVFPPAIVPDDVLNRLLVVARYEARGGLPPDAQLRLRNAGAFRSAYLGSSPGTYAAGIIIFPAPAARLFAVALQLTLGVQVDESRVETFVFLFE